MLTAWTQDCPTVLSGRDRSYHSPGILEEGSVRRLRLGTQSVIEKADGTEQDYKLDTIEKPTSGLDNQSGTQETHGSSLLDKEAKSNE